MWMVFFRRILFSPLLYAAGAIILCIQFCLLEGGAMAERRIAVCYDFDKTLSPDDMQAFTFIPSLGMRADDFWAESNRIAHANGMDTNLSWMKLMLDKASEKGMSISRPAFRALGRDVKLYEGVIGWFDRVSGYGKQKGISVEHYIISSGLKEIIEGSEVAPFIKRIYASGFYYSEDGAALWPAQAVNYTNKTQYIFRIAKGAFDENDKRVNDSFEEKNLYIPYENMIYIGDSETDIPCMRLIKSKGGISIGVYDPMAQSRRRVYDLYRDGRINYFAPADYRAEKMLDCLIRRVIDLVAAREALKEESDRLSAMVDKEA